MKVKIWELREKLTERIWVGASKEVRILDLDGKILDIQQVTYDAEDDQFYLIAAQPT